MATRQLAIPPAAHKGDFMYESKETRSSFDPTALSDGELVCGIVANANETDARLVDELWRRVGPVLVNVAKDIAFNKGYGFTEEDALSEAHAAAWDALRLYDANKGASLKTYLRTKVKYHFKDLWRQSAIHAGRFIPYGEGYEEDDDGESHCGANYSDICKVVSRKYDQECREREIADACLKARSLVTKRRHRECLDLLLEAFELGEKNAIPYAAERLGCSRQQVYNILNQICDQLPDDLANELRDLL